MNVYIPLTPGDLFRKGSRATLCIAFLFVLCNTASAQLGEQRSNFAVGINGGMNYAMVTLSPSVKQGGQMGINGGITARYISEKYFAMICGLQMEINFSQRGWKEALDEDQTGDPYFRTMNYIEVPFLAHLAFGRERGVRFFLNLGPEVAFLLSEKETTKDFTPVSTTEQYGKLADNRFDYGITGGAGLEIRTGAGNFLLEGRYYFGLADFYNNTKKDYFSRSAHSVISAKITYLFDLKK